MAEWMYRAQILLEPEQHRALVELAQQEGRSISDVARELIRLGLEQVTAQRQRKRQAFERLNRIRQEVHETHGVYPGDVLTEEQAEQERRAEGAARQA